jgi:hypothetical protein
MYAIFPVCTKHGLFYIPISYNAPHSAQGLQLRLHPLRFLFSKIFTPKGGHGESKTDDEITV